MQNFTLEKNNYEFQLFKDLRNYQNSHFEIFVLEKTKDQVEINGRYIKPSDMSVLFAAPSQNKKWNFDTKKTKGFHLVFDTHFFSDLLGDKLFAYRLHYFFTTQHPQYLKLSIDDFNFIKMLLNEINDAIKNNQKDSKSNLKHLFFNILIKLNKLFSKKNKLSSETQGDIAIYKFKESLERNIRKFHMVDDYCDILQIQRNKLNRIVKTHFGITAKETIHK